MYLREFVSPSAAISALFSSNTLFSPLSAGLELNLFNHYAVEYLKNVTRKKNSKNVTRQNIAKMLGGELFDN